MRAGLCVPLQGRHDSPPGDRGQPPRPGRDDAPLAAAASSWYTLGHWSSCVWRWPLARSFLRGGPRCGVRRVRVRIRPSASHRRLCWHAVQRPLFSADRGRNAPFLRTCQTSGGEHGIMGRNQRGGLREASDARAGELLGALRMPGGNPAVARIFRLPASDVAPCSDARRSCCLGKESGPFGAFCCQKGLRQDDRQERRCLIDQAVFG